MSGTVDELVRKLLAWLEREGWCKRVDLPRRVAARRSDERPLPGLACSRGKNESRSASPRTRCLPPPASSFVNESLDAAIAFAERHGARLPQRARSRSRWHRGAQARAARRRAPRALARGRGVARPRGSAARHAAAPGHADGTRRARGRRVEGARRAQPRAEARCAESADAYSEWLTEIAEKAGQAGEEDAPSRVASAEPRGPFADRGGHIQASTP